LSIADASEAEARPLALSSGYFALLLASYYMIRPLRDAAGAASGADTIRHLAGAVFIVMLLLVPAYGWLVARVPRTRLLPLTYGCFALQLAAFGGLFALAPEDPWINRAFYVWTTVYNLFVVSVFWSFMADVWNAAQARRLFGVIAAGGSLGGLAGPLLTRALVGSVGTAGIACLAATMLAATVILIRRLAPPAGEGAAERDARLDEPLGGAALAAFARLAGSPFLIGIAALIALGSLIAMIVYIELTRYAAASIAGGAARTAFFAGRDLSVNVASFALQFVAVGWLTRHLGLRALLSGCALLAVGACAVLGAAPGLYALLAANVVMRSAELGLAKPARDMLYTVVDGESRYKVKNLIDTLVYRGADLVSGWIHAGLVALGATLAVLGWLAALVALALGAVAFAVGTGYGRRHPA
jgi:AAA family ATP:ADP antiporter